MRRAALGLGACLLLALAACAGPTAATRASHEALPLAPADETVWQALIAGRRSDAEKALAVGAPSTLLASLARAGWAFNRASPGLSVTAALEVLKLAPRERTSWRGLDAVAMSWLATWLDEGLPREEERRQLEGALEAIYPDTLTWEARFLRADALMRSARRRLDPAALEAASSSWGCQTNFVRGPSLGPLPHLDLEHDGRAATASGRSATVPLPHSGCDVEVFSADGRASADRAWAHLSLPRTGPWRLVLDAASEARLLIDGREVARHGNARDLPSRFSTSVVSLDRGEHEVEVRLANGSGHVRFALSVVPAGPSAAELLEVAAASAGERVEGKAQSSWVALWAAAILEARLGAATKALAFAERLETAPTFFLGQITVGEIRRGDPSRPTAFGRDAARQTFARALAADATLARVAEAAAALETDDEHPREALAILERASRAISSSASPTDDAKHPRPSDPDGWWALALARSQALRARGLGEEADDALAMAVRHGQGSCVPAEAALRRAQERRQRQEEEALSVWLGRSCPGSSALLLRLAEQGRQSDRSDLLTRIVAVTPSREDALSDLAEAQVALHRSRDAVPLLERLVRQAPLDASYRLRLVDAWAATGDLARARRSLVEAMNAHPESGELLRAARTFGVSLPLDPFRLDGASVIRDFEKKGRAWDAPAVMVLDRAVTRVFPEGAAMTLTHNIVRVQTKDGIEKWGEVAVPEGAEILTLRTHKADGSVREAESIAGKDAISAPDLAVGDYVEWETLETEAPSLAFRGGFLGERFYFRSYDAPLERTEALLVTSRDRLRGLTWDLRAGAPSPREEPAPAGAGDVAVLALRREHVPQLFAERSAVPAIEYVPSVRVTSGVSWAAWGRYVEEELYGTTRTTPVVQAAARDIRRELEGRASKAHARAGDASVASEHRSREAFVAPRTLAEAVVAWTNQHVEATDDLDDTATLAIARGRGSRIAVVQALARELGIPCEMVLARSRLLAAADAATPVAELDDFAEPLLRFVDLEGKGNESGDVYVDVRLKHAPLGYLPPALDGARFLALGKGGFGSTHGRGDDQRRVDLSLHLESEGGGRARAREDLRGWPALEWAELVDRFGADEARLRQDFEQRWLGAQFPGAILEDLQVDVLGPGGETLPVRAAGDAPFAYAAAGVRLRYSFSSAQLGTRRAHELTLLPTFFRSQPGRRFATEARRATALQLGYDIPLDLRATVELPAAARAVDMDHPEVERVGQGAGYLFAESREVVTQGAAPAIVLRRDARVPLMRVTPDNYPRVAADLRRVDVLEQRPLRIRLSSGDRERPLSGAQP